jgi:hypothetical protein
MWDAIWTLMLAMLIMAAIFGWPMYYVINHWLKPVPKPVRHPYREPCVFVNSFGHFVRVDPNPAEMQRVKEYFDEHPDEAREALNSLHNDYEEEW